MSGEKKTYSPKNTDFAGDTAFVADYANHREEANHLGNVLDVVSDRKIGVEDQGSPGTVEYYEADVVSAQDYYPFGMIMPGRSVSAGEYWYGFNSMEQDDEWSFTGGHYDFDTRMYDSRLGQFLSLDPLSREFPGQSDYMAFNGNPVFFIDPDGKAGVAHKDDENNIITVKAEMVLYGDAASPGLANETAAKLERDWNRFDRP